MRRDTGGAAFPEERVRMMAGYPTDKRDPVPGMTLRDYFAARAMAALMVSDDVDDDVGAVAALAYKQADAMLAERAK